MFSSSANAEPKGEVGPRVFGLDFLRALAITGVVFSHGFVVLYPHAVVWLGFFGHGGFYGVELFFVLSGFLIGRILIRTGAELGRARTVLVFYLRRWFRTLPLFWLFVGVNVFLEWHLRDHRFAAREIGAHAFFLRTLTEHRLTFFAESWSLAIEEWFYLLFPVVLWIGLKITKRFNPVFLSAAVIFYLFSTVGRIVSVHHPEATRAEWQRVIVIYRFDALMIGVVAAWISVHFAESWRARKMICAILGRVLLLALYLSLWRLGEHGLIFAEDDFFARTFRFNLVSLGFALLIPAASLWKAARKSFWTSSVRRIALWSYALYLVHLPVFQVVMRYCFTAWQTSLSQAIASFILQIGGSIAISALLFRYFESPCTRLRERVAPATRR